MLLIRTLKDPLVIHFGIAPEKTLYDIIVKNTPTEECITKVRDNIDIIASNEHLFPAENHMHKQKNRELILKIKSQVYFRITITF